MDDRQLTLMMNAAALAVGSYLSPFIRQKIRQVVERMPNEQLRKALLTDLLPRRRTEGGHVRAQKAYAFGKGLGRRWALRK